MRYFHLFDRILNKNVLIFVKIRQQRIVLCSVLIFVKVDDHMAALD